MIDTKKAYKIINENFSAELANRLLEINAVILRPQEPFTWASGWNSPIYCDNRLTLRYPELRDQISDIFTEFIQTNYPKTDVITGTATAGIPHSAWVAQKLNKPLAYVRAKAKAYGLGNQIEGGVNKSEKTVVIEDLISTGGSVLSVVEALNFIGADVQAVFSIFTYGFDQANHKFTERNLPLYCLTDYETLINVALSTGKIEESDLELLSSWRQNPQEWPNE